MNKNQALEVLINAASQARLTASDHALVQQAFVLLKDELNPVHATSPEAPKNDPA